MRQAEGAMSDGGSAVKCELAAEVLCAFGTLRFTATGWSMLPAIWPGDTLLVDRVSSDQVRMGDVVLVGRDGRLCAHRIVSEAEDTGNPHWITQGDAMPAADRPVNGDELLGRVAHVIRAGKLVAVPAKLSVVERLTAKIVRRSLPAARALVYLRRAAQISGRSLSEKSVLPCQG
jgi:signal peptidase I